MSTVPVIPPSDQILFDALKLKGDVEALRLGKPPFHLLTAEERNEQLAALDLPPLSIFPRPASDPRPAGAAVTPNDCRRCGATDAVVSCRCEACGHFQSGRAAHALAPVQTAPPRFAWLRKLTDSQLIESLSMADEREPFTPIETEADREPFINEASAELLRRVGAIPRFPWLSDLADDTLVSLTDRVNRGAVAFIRSDVDRAAFKAAAAAELSGRLNRCMSEPTADERELIEERIATMDAEADPERWDGLS